MDKRFVRGNGFLFSCEHFNSSLPRQRESGDSRGAGPLAPGPRFTHASRPLFGPAPLFASFARSGGDDGVVQWLSLNGNSANGGVSGSASSSGADASANAYGAGQGASGAVNGSAGISR